MENIKTVSRIISLEFDQTEGDATHHWRITETGHRTCSIHRDGELVGALREDPNNGTIEVGFDGVWFTHRGVLQWEDMTALGAWVVRTYPIA